MLPHQQNNSKSYLDSKSILFEVINNSRLNDRVCIVSALRALTMQDSITESKTISYILFMIFC